MDEGTKDRKIVGADWIAADDFRVELDVSDPENPRLKMNLPANKGFFELTEETTPPFMIVVARADNPIVAKGLLAEAHDCLLLMQHKLNKLAALTLGVGDATGKDLTKLPPKERLKLS